MPIMQYVNKVTDPRGDSQISPTSSMRQARVYDFMDLR